MSEQNNLRLGEAIELHDEVIAKINNNIKGLRAHKKILDCQEFPKTCHLLNLSLFIALSVSDLIVSTKYLGLSISLNNGIESNYFSRVASVQLYEFFNDIKILTGKKFRESIYSEVGDENESMNKLYECCSELNKISKKHNKTLKKIRVNVIAHREKDGHSQSEIMLEIKNVEIFNLSNQVWRIGAKLITHAVDIANQIEDPAP